jgi:sirohydrochlorin cobaltochelatase
VVNGLSKKALLVISFGTSVAETRQKTIEATEQTLRDAFPGYAFRRAFTSQMVIRTLRERDHLEVDTVEKAATALAMDGYTEVLTQPLHIINGTEFHKAIRELQSFTRNISHLSIGSPLLTDLDDYVATVAALKSVLPVCVNGEAVVLMGHGSQHPANAAYCQMDYVLKEAGLTHVHLATVEGYPSLNSVIRRLDGQQIKKVTLMPFMLVAGDHALNDMAGDEPDSWKSILAAKGYTVDICLTGLGEIEGIRQIFVDHARKSLERDRS